MFRSAIRSIPYYFCVFVLSCSTHTDTPDASVDFNDRIRDWDGFGVNYVEVRHTRDYTEWPQDYGGFKYLSESQRREIIDLIFGEDGLQPSLAKMFLCPYHEPAPDNADPHVINMAGFDHASKTEHMRWFIREGLEKTRSRGGDLTILAGLYAAPGWAIKQGEWGRDLNPAMRHELAEYMISWAKYLKETEQLPVKYISIFNEEEFPEGYREDGYAVWHDDHSRDSRRDRAPWWPKEQVVDFLTFMPGMISAHGLADVGMTNGETVRWDVLSGAPEIGSIADAIAADEQAQSGLGLITSHGFGAKDGHYASAGIDRLRAHRPDLHAWTTSCNWGRADSSNVNFIYGFRQQIYKVGVNGIIPWAVCFCRAESDRTTWGKSYKSGNTNTPFHVYPDGTYEVRKSYYYYKHLTRAGCGGMSVAQVAVQDSSLELIAFSGRNTVGTASGHSDAFILVNKSKMPRTLVIQVSGASSGQFDAWVTTDGGAGEKNYEPVNAAFTLSRNRLEYQAPAQSVTTFIGR